jgi:hypothetical protein
VAPTSPIVIAGLDPAIYLPEMMSFFKMDTRVKPAYDESMIGTEEARPAQIIRHPHDQIGIHL